MVPVRSAKCGVPGHAATAALCGVLAAIFYRSLSPALTRSERELHLARLRVLRDRASLALRPVRQSPPLHGIGPTGQLVLLLLSVLGASRNAAMLGPACAAVVALTLSVAQRAPLGTGRTDECLYPGLLLLLASVAVRLWAVVRDHLDPAHVRAAGTAIAFVSVVLAGALIGDTIASPMPYPGVGVQALAAALRHDAEPSDHIVVGELTRYPWAYSEDHPLRLRFGPDWATHVTVTTTDPKVFIVPSGYDEGGSQPARWASAFRHDHRLWFVVTPPLSLNPTDAARGGIRCGLCMPRDAPSSSWSAEGCGDDPGSVWPHSWKGKRWWTDRRGTVRGQDRCCSCTAPEGKPVRIRRWSATVNGAPPR